MVLKDRCTVGETKDMENEWEDILQVAYLPATSAALGYYQEQTIQHTCSRASLRSQTRNRDSRTSIGGSLIFLVSNDYFLSAACLCFRGSKGMLQRMQSTTLQVTVLKHLFTPHRRLLLAVNLSVCTSDVNAYISTICSPFSAVLSFPSRTKDCGFEVCLW